MPDTSKLMEMELFQMRLNRSFFSKQLRFILGFLLLAIIIFLRFHYYNAERIIADVIKIIIITYLIWLVSTCATDKYVNKYPQRFLSYTIAKNSKAFFIVIFLMGILLISNLIKFSIFVDIAWILMISFGLDFLLDLFRKKEAVVDIDKQMDNFVSNLNYHNSNNNQEPVSEVSLNIQQIINNNEKNLPDYATNFIREHITNDENSKGTFIILDKQSKGQQTTLPTDISLILCKTSLNNVVRLNDTLKNSIQRLIRGGYIIVSYTPMEMELEKLKKESLKITYPFKYIANFLFYRGLIKIKWLSSLYFSKPFSWIDKLREKCTDGKRRSLARAEVWGRLVYYGMDIIEEKIDGDRAYIIAKKVSDQSENRTPTYHAVVTLEKVGLYGSIIRLHKVRSMYPFSEFLQKNLYNMNGLTNTGKFKNDFRLTDYGPFIRKYWIDEIPGIIDWLKGDIKLVGMRATSPHYLNLYPKSVIEKYLQVKPGLIPPIFDEKTAGFDQIVEIEGNYLEKYLSNPIKTDIQYLWYTFRDIFIRKVRSK